MMAATSPTQSLATLAGQINEEHRRCEMAIASGLGHALRAGQLLLEAKALCPHGTWLSWLATHFEGSTRTAQAYMRVAERSHELTGPNAQRAAHLTLRGALAVLADPRGADTEHDGDVTTGGSRVQYLADAVAESEEALRRLTMLKTRTMVEVEALQTAVEIAPTREAKLRGYAAIIRKMEMLEAQALAGRLLDEERLWEAIGLSVGHVETPGMMAAVNLKRVEAAATSVIHAAHQRITDLEAAGGAL